MFTHQDPQLGMCPVCSADIASYDVLIEYKTSDGQPAVYAYCPECEDAPYPE